MSWHSYGSISREFCPHCTTRYNAGCFYVMENKNNPSRVVFAVRGKQSVCSVHVASLRARNICSAQAFWTFRYLICHVVAFLKIIEINTLQCRSVEENILLTFALRDEAKASIIETNDFAFVHRCGKISFLTFQIQESA